MNNGNAIIFHYYAYRKPYIIFWIFIFLLCPLLLFFRSNETAYLYATLVLLLVDFLFTFCLGIYEYNKLAEHYINLKTIRREYYYGSLIFSVLHSLLQLAGISFVFAAFYLIANNHITLSTVFPYRYLSTYLFLFTIQIAIFIGANTLTLILKKISNIFNLTLLLLLIFFCMFFFEIAKSGVGYILNFFNNPQLIYRVIPILYISVLPLVLLNSFLFRYKISEKK